MDSHRLIAIMSFLFHYLALLAIALTYAGIFAKREKESISLMKIARSLFAVSIGLLGLMSILYVLRFGHFGYPIPYSYDTDYSYSFFNKILGIISGIVFIVASIGIFIKKKARLASLLLAGIVANNILFIYIPVLANSSGFLQVILHQLALAAGALTWAGILARKEVKNTYETLENSPESSIEAPTEKTD